MVVFFTSILCGDQDNLFLHGSAPAASMQTLDHSLPDHLPSLYDSPSEDFYMGNENKLLLFSDIRLQQKKRKQLHSRGNHAFVFPSKSYYCRHTKNIKEAN